jgi:acetyltransferase-like isoleucine patch superfamily enzyme
MIAWRIFFITKIFYFFPETRLFRIKAVMLRWAGASVGRGFKLCSSVRIIGQGPLEIGDHVWIGPETLIVASSLVKIGSHSAIAPRVYIGTGTHDIDSKGLGSAGNGVSKNVVIEDGVWLGAGVMVLAGVTVGKKSVIAAGAVVANDAPQGMVVGGVPAKVIRSL